MQTLQSNHAGKRQRRLECLVAADPQTVVAAQRLRYRIFAEEMGAELHSRVEGLDYDEFDDHCDHLVVRDLQKDAIAGCTRLMGQDRAERMGGFYSQSEFHLEGVLNLPGRLLEVGRTCVDPAYRGGVVLTTLWSGLVDYALSGGYDYLIGCASISPGPSGFAVDAVYREIGSKLIGFDVLPVSPKRPVPASLRCNRDESGIPPLLRAYLRFGASICGEPCWDPDFNVMDVFILLPLDRMESRYSRHFFKGEGEYGFQTASIL